MPKGKTSSPLRIKVLESWLKHPAVQELHAVGHQIIPVAGDDADLVLDTRAGWHESLFEQFKRENGTPYRPYLDARIAWARAQKRSQKA